MMVNPIPRLSVNNAAFNMMNASASLMQGGNSNALNGEMLNDNLIYKASLLMEDSQKRAKMDNIKRTFDVFA